jgi:hypothetical protein
LPLLAVYRLIFHELDPENKHNAIVNWKCHPLGDWRIRSYGERILLFRKSAENGYRHSLQHRLQPVCRQDRQHNRRQLAARVWNRDGRTAIGYRIKNNAVEVVFGIFTSPKIFELHKIMKYLGCSNALSLDGGGSSQAKWKSGGSNASYDGDDREVLCEIALSASAAANCVWNGTD